MKKVLKNPSLCRARSSPRCEGPRRRHRSKAAPVATAIAFYHKFLEKYDHKKYRSTQKKKSCPLEAKKLENSRFVALFSEIVDFPRNSRFIHFFGQNSIYTILEEPNGQGI